MATPADGPPPGPHFAADHMDFHPRRRAHWDADGTAPWSTHVSWASKT